MKLKYEKSVRIATDLLGYCRHLGADDFHVDLSMAKDKARILVTAIVAEPSATILQEINQSLRIPRQYEVEQNYWSIGGGDHSQIDLAMVGMMVDTSIVNYENGMLRIEVERFDL